MLLPYREFFRFLYLALNPTTATRNHVVSYYNRLTDQRYPLAWTNEHCYDIYCECEKRNDYWADICYHCGGDMRLARQKVDDLIKQFQSTSLGQQHCFIFANTRAFRTNDSEEMCSICLIPFKQEDLVHEAPKCSHLFHPLCLKQWLRHSLTCPMCRRHMLECYIRFFPDSYDYFGDSMIRW